MPAWHRLATMQCCCYFTTLQRNHECKVFHLRRLAKLNARLIKGRQSLKLTGEPAQFQSAHQFTSIKTTKPISMNEFAWCQRINPTPDSGSFHYQKSFIHSRAPPHIPSKLFSIGNIRRTHSRASYVIKRECIRKGEGERAKKMKPEQLQQQPRRHESAQFS